MKGLVAGLVNVVFRKTCVAQAPRRPSWRRMGGVFVTAVASLTVASCSSDTGKPGKPTTGALCTVARDPGPSPMRRLTRVEYARTLGDLVGPGLVDASTLPADERVLGFDNNAEVLGTSDLLIEQYQDLAEKAAAAVAADAARFVPCAASAPDDTCGQEFVRDFGARAWRRPLAPAELESLNAVFTAGSADAGFTEGLLRVAAVLLQSPQFLYRLEEARPVPADPSEVEVPGAVALSPPELATRLSYLFWGTMPDEALRAAAREGRLVSAADIEREARRLVASPRAREVVTVFHDAWLGLDRLAELDKDPVVFPAFSPAMRTAFQTETERFVDDVIWNGEGTLGALLGARRTFVDGSLASFYGATPPSGSGFQRVALDPKRRAGLLTQGSFLAVHAKANQTSPVHRGRFVREQLFCTTPPPPPSNVEIRPPALDPRKTTRQRFSQHVADIACSGCHTLLDPIGFGFENYDGVGRWRDSESGIAVDASGALLGTDVDGPFTGAVELADRLAASADVASCYATQWFRFAYGRGETEADACSLQELSGTFAAAKGDVRELLVSLTQTDAFRFVRATEVAP